MASGETSSSLIKVDKRDLVIAVEDGSGKGGGDVIRVHNIADEDVAFKMKTTNPNRYIVRPNVSCIPKGQHCDIRIYLAENVAQPLPGPSKDRFQLRVARAPGLSENNANNSAAEFWKDNENDPNLLRLKFFVKFIPHVQHTATAAATYSNNNAQPADLDEGARVQALLQPDKKEEAVAKAALLENTLRERDADLANIRTQLKETIEEKKSTLANAPKTPLNANPAFWDSYGGLGVASIVLVIMVAIFAIFFNRT